MVLFTHEKYCEREGVFSSAPENTRPAGAVVFGSSPVTIDPPACISSRHAAARAAARKIPGIRLINRLP